MDKNTILWEIKKSKTMLLVKNVYNWFERLYMKMRGYSPTTFNPYTNKYEYELKSEVDKLENWEEEQPFEIFGYNRGKTEQYWWWNNDGQAYREQKRARIRKCKSLSRGECIDKPLFTRNTE